MISIYTDEDVDVLMKPLLNAKGFTVFNAVNEQMLGKSDKEQLDHAIKLKSAFLTHNRIHFERLASELFEKGKEHYGIIIASRRNIYEVTRRASRLLELHTAEYINNKLWYI